MNPKPANTMKHLEMLNKSTDVNVKKVMTRSSSRGSEAGMGIEEMDYGNEAGNSTIDKNGSSSVNSDMASEDISVEKIEVVKESEIKEGVVGKEANGNVSDMFPELISTKVSKVSVDKMPEIPIPVEHKPVLNSECARNSG